MNKEIINMQTKRVEKALSCISAKLAAAGTLIIDAQQDIDDLYITLEKTEEAEKREEKEKTLRNN